MSAQTYPADTLQKKTAECDIELSVMAPTTTAQQLPPTTAQQLPPVGAAGGTVWRYF